MLIQSESRIAWPRAKVYAAYRDRLPEVAKYIPDVKAVVVLSREARPTGVKLHNEWVGDREIPSYAAPFLKPEHLRWDDFAEWNDAEHSVAWTLKTRAFTEAVRCSGRNSFYEDGPNATRVVLTGDLTMDLADIPGLPGFLGKRLAPQVEKFIVQLIQPNLEQVNRSLQQFLDAGN